MGRPRKKISEKPLTPERPDVYDEFVRFTAFPSVLRDKEFGYMNDTGFAAHFKMNQDTLSKWRGRTQFWDAVSNQLKAWGKGQTADVIMGLLRKAVKEGGAAEVKLWLQYFEEFKEKGETTHTANREQLQQIQQGIRDLVTQEKKK